MLFDLMKVDESFATGEVKRLAASLLENKGVTDFNAFAAGVITRRLDKDKRRYLDYGPYWWAVKEVLKRFGYDYGTQSDPLVRAEYEGSADSITLVMADLFRKDYLAAYPIGSNQFMLDSEGDFYTLVDGDIEE